MTYSSYFFTANYNLSAIIPHVPPERNREKGIINNRKRINEKRRTGYTKVG